MWRLVAKPNRPPKAVGSPSVRLSQRHLFTSSRPARVMRPSSIVGSLTEALSSKITAAAERALLPEERLVTELRRPLDLRYHSAETLAERLEHQRSIRARLVPTHITVDKSRQYVEFVWPMDAVVAAERQRIVVAWREERDRRRAAGEAVPDEEEPKAADVHPPQELLRAQTRGLAEYLRAYTTSTDGSFGDGRNLIYGRRGITVKDAYPVGQYALRIIFSDDHSGGIYPYEYLYQLTCPHNKMNLMRQYIQVLRARKKSRDPPQRKISRRRLDKSCSSAAAAAASARVASPEASNKSSGRTSSVDDYVAPAFEPER